MKLEGGNRRLAQGGQAAAEEIEHSVVMGHVSL